MLDFNTIEKKDYENIFDTKNPEEIGLWGFNNYVHEYGIENFFDKNLLIDWSKGEDSWEEIDSPKTWVTMQYESNPELFDDYEK